MGHFNNETKGFFMRLLIIALVSISVVGCVKYTPNQPDPIYSMLEPMTLSDFAE